MPGFCIQGGDIIKNDGTGGESIYGPTFEDESFRFTHNRKYMLGMANLGEKNTNSSQFYITTDRAPYLDQVHVVFGHVIKGQDVVDEIQLLGDAEGKPTKSIVISDCGCLRRPQNAKPRTLTVEEKPEKLIVDTAETRKE